MLNKRILLILALLVSVLFACTQPDEMTDPVVDSGDAQADVVIDVTASNESPADGDMVDLTIRVMSRGEVGAASVAVKSTDQLRAQSGSLWSGNMATNDSVEVVAQVEVVAWPVSEALEIVVEGGAGSYSAYWPQNLSNNGVIIGVNTTIDPSPSIDMTMTMSPENPQVGDIVRFDVTMVSQIGISDVTSSLTLPEGMEKRQFEEEETLRFAIFEPQTTSFTAQMTAETAGMVIYALDLGNGEIDTAQVRIGPEPIMDFPHAKGIEMTGVAVAYEATDVVDAVVDSAEILALNPPQISPIDITPIETDGLMTVYLYANENVTNVTASVSFPSTLRASAAGWTGALAQDKGTAFEFPIERINDGAGTLTISVTSDKGEQSFDYYFPALGAGDEREVSAPNTYRGRFRYREDGVTSTGIYFARVQVYDEDGGLAGADDLICSTTTDSTGNWECSGSASDGAFDDTIETYAKVSAINSNTGEVEDASDDLYAYKTTNRNTDEDGGTTIDYGSWFPPSNTNHDGAWHVQKSAGLSWAAVNYQGGETPPTSSSSNFIAFQYPGDGTGASFYNNNRINICGPACGDPDPWDETVHFHEYGHYIQDIFADLDPPNVSYCNSPGETTNCGHGMTTIEDPPTAYIEGWANYFQSWVKYYWGMPRPEDYIETTWSFDQETSWRNPSSNAQSIEATTAGILLDIIDSPQDDQNNDGVGDILDRTATTVWDTFSYYNPPGTAVHPWTINDYYTGFQVRNSFDDEVRRIFYEHGIDNNNAPNAPPHVSPSNGATNQSVALYLDFSASSNPDNDDPLTYTVYLETGDTTPDQVVCEDIVWTHCYVSGLDYYTWYYWRVKAEDVYGETAFSSAWFFRTEAVPTAVELSETATETAELAPRVGRSVILIVVLGLVTVGVIKTNKRVG